MKQPHRSSRPLPLLMIPLRRCGSHALRLRLNASPSFHSPYPLHIVDFMPLVPMYGDLSDDSTKPLRAAQLGRITSAVLESVSDVDAGRDHTVNSTRLQADRDL